MLVFTSSSVLGKSLAWKKTKYSPPGRAEQRTGADANSLRSVRREAAWKHVETPWGDRDPVRPWGEAAWTTL